MRSRIQGLILIVVGVVGLALISVGWAAGPPAARWGPGAVMERGGMAGMHAWMHGSAESGQTAPGPVPGASQVRVVARDFSFSPDQVRLAAGATVNLVLVNQGDVLHDLTVPALGFRVEAAAGATAMGALGATRPGRYGFLCSVPGHQQAGMSGVLVVT
jgi:plastocyanin